MNRLDRTSRAVDGGLKSVVTALDLLTCFYNDDQLGVTDLATRLGVSKSSAHRLLTSLCDREFIMRDPETGRYKLGLRIYELGQLSVSRVSIKSQAIPILDGLRQRTGFTVHLAVPAVADVVYVERLYGRERYPDLVRTSTRMPVHLSGSGKAIAAFDPAIADARRAAGFPPRTATSIHDLAGFNAALDVVRRRGFAVNDQEVVSGITSVAAPVRSRRGAVVGAISLVATTHELNGRIESNARLAIAAAGHLAGKLGA